MMKAKAVTRPIADKLQELARRSPKTFQAIEVLVDFALTQIGPEAGPDPIMVSLSSLSKTVPRQPGERAKPFDPRAGVKRQDGGAR